jgi:hypothetical protein
MVDRIGGLMMGRLLCRVGEVAMFSIGRLMKGCYDFDVLEPRVQWFGDKEEAGLYIGHDEALGFKGLVMSDDTRHAMHANLCMPALPHIFILFFFTF